jgi:(S)-2-hydroxyglutarate dehydrogenase
LENLVNMLADFLIIGGGIIGISIARELKKLYPNERVVLLEKEKTCGLHASGRNSGVLHAGFYYSPDSLKAQFTRLGNKSLTEYCDKKGIPINKCGKLVVAKDADDLPALHELLMRGLANGVELQELTEKEAKEIEPRVRTYERALFSPNTATVDPVAVVNAMKEDAIQEGIQVLCGVQYLSKQESTIQTSSDTAKPAI